MARARKSMIEVAAAARAAERDACVDYLRDKISEVQGLQRRGRLSASESDQLVRRLDAVADGITAGLHL